MPILPQTIQVADKQTLLIQYKSVPVMTTEQLADFYGTDSNNVKVNHSRNSSRFVQGKHYFKVEGVDLKDFKNWVTESNSVQIGKNASSIILWTEKGAARHAKILETDQAWDIFEQLEEVYFAVKEKTHLPALPNFTDPAEAAMAWAEQYKAKQLAEKQVSILEPKAKALDTIANTDGTYTIRECAKTIGIGERKLVQLLIDKKWVFRENDGRLQPYAEKTTAGIFINRPSPVITNKNTGEERVHLHMRITAFGLTRITGLVNRAKGVTA